MPMKTNRPRTTWLPFFWWGRGGGTSLDQTRHEGKTRLILYPTSNLSTALRRIRLISLEPDPYNKLGWIRNRNEFFSSWIRIWSAALKLWIRVNNVHWTCCPANFKSSKFLIERMSVHRSLASFHSVLDSRQLLRQCQAYGNTQVAKWPPLQ